LSRAAPFSKKPRIGTRSEIWPTLKEGEFREGVVKNITDYGAFVDLGGVDGLLHVTDISLEARQPPVRSAATWARR
jgi:ribosomal protein S1